MVGGARVTILSVTRSAMLLGFSHATVSHVYQEWSTTQRTSRHLKTVRRIGVNIGQHPCGTHSHLVETMPRQIEDILRVIGGANQYLEGVPNVLYTQCRFLM
jgi:hypothetical protein